jgi:predicted RNA-binding protein YlxR (DUF448 family)
LKLKTLLLAKVAVTQRRVIRLTKSTQAQDNDRQRRCIVEARSLDKANMIRFVLAPDGMVVPDIDHVLPGRGMWVQARPELISRAVREGRFSRAARTKVGADPELSLRVESLLARKLQDMIGLARRAGRMVMGYEKTTAALRAKSAVVLLSAYDGADDGRNKLQRQAPHIKRAGSLSASELGHAFGREHVVHAALLATSERGKDGLQTRLCLADARLALMRGNHEGDLENFGGGCIQASSRPQDAT